MPERVKLWEPTPKQSEYLSAPEEEVGYGGAAGGGKMLSLDTPVPTPSGWTTMGELSVGDEVFDENGSVCRVTFVSPVNQTPETYRVIFDDRSEILACSEHRWLTYDVSELAALTRRDPAWRAKRRETRPSEVSGNKSLAFTEAVTKRNRVHVKFKPVPTGTVRTTEQIASTLTNRFGRRNHAVPVSRPLDLPPLNLPIDPYVLGAWLGDGSRTGGVFTGIDPEIWHEIESAGFVVTHSPTNPQNHFIRGIAGKLRECGLIGNKHVPPRYLRASEGQRRSLLQGLMDTDGHSRTEGSSQFCNTNENLAYSVYELVVSLGMKASITEGRATFQGKDCGPKWTINFTPNCEVYRLPRKLENIPSKTRRTTKFRYVVSCAKETTVPMRCIAVDSPSHLYLASKSMVPTHNTDALGIDALGLWQDAVLKPSYRSVIIRRTIPELSQIIDRSLELYPQIVRGAAFNKVEREWTFPSGAKHVFAYAETPADKYRFQGKEFQFVGWEELTQQPTDEVYRYLWTRLRTSDPTIKPLVRSTFNPGGVGHEWVKDLFSIPDDGSATRHTVTVPVPNADGSVTNLRIRRRFIPARLADNPFLGPEYRAQLMLMPEMDRRALLDGRWDVVDIPGQIYKAEIERLYTDGRVATVPYDPALPVHTWWDLGVSDSTPIWFVQAVNQELHLIDYHEAAGEGLPYYAKVLKDKGYAYGVHVAPHDIAVRELGTGKSRIETAKALGIEFSIAPNLPLEDGIEASRSLFAACWFDKEKCAEGLKALRNYRRDYNQHMGEFKASPVHDRYSHPADAFRMGAVARGMLSNAGSEYAVFSTGW